MELFPYEPRKNQKEMMHSIINILTSHRDLVLESTTGSGKTVCALTAAVGFALKNDKKIVYATRTNAQQKQVIIELREIKKHAPKKTEKILAVGIQGRANMCLLARDDPELTRGSSEELSRFCSNEKKKARSTSGNKEKGCPYYRNFINDKETVDKTISWAKEKIPTAEEFIAYCERERVCPYEINKLLVREATVVIVPYIYVFDQLIRNMLFDWLSIPESDTILIVDEGHNLPDYIRDLFSVQLSKWMLTSCLSEAEKFGDPSLADGKVSVSDFCKMLIDIIVGIRDTYVYEILEKGIRKQQTGKDDAFIPSHEFETEILSRLGITSRRFHDVISDLIAYGEKIQEYRQKEGKLPRSYLHKLGVFLDLWTNIEMKQYAKLVVDVAQGKNPRIEAYCLDPSVGASIIRKFHASIHMSGTLEPLEEYRDSMGLPSDAELISYSSPFPIDNRRILFVRDVTTRYEEIMQNERIVPRMKEYITSICNEFPRNTMVFFPSFDTMSTFLDEGIQREIDRNLIVEEQSMSQTELMNIVSDFKETGNHDSDGSALFSVIGGRISEGMDFPAEELEIAVIVGIPYPKPTARQRGLKRYYDMKFRKGWEYTVEAPTARKLLQSIGRLIRDKNDRGVAVILDRRAMRFKRYIKDMQESKNPVAEIKDFLSAPRSDPGEAD